MAKKATKKRARVTKPQSPRQQSLLDMTSTQARAFLLKPESYCTVDLPDYLQFGGILTAVAKLLRTKPLSELRKDSPRKHEDVNYAMLSNKDGRHAWRPFQLIHPAMYVSLVNRITEKSHWATIRKRFAEFAAIDTIECLSIPAKSLSKQKDQAEQILQWWQGIEQGSIELALDYQFVLHADITDCYAAIYTHSIAWALHGRDVAKAKRNDKTLIGNLIDARIQDMRHGQTNGIPQGSVLMNLIAEMVLGYADLQLSNRLQALGITDYRILRYRDDYRIFVNNPQLGETILKALTEVMIELGLKLNAAKTTGSQSVVSGSLKADKRAWMTGRQGDKNLQRHLLVLHAHGMEFGELLDGPHSSIVGRPLFAPSGHGSPPPCRRSRRPRMMMPAAKPPPTNAPPMIMPLRIASPWRATPSAAYRATRFSCARSNARSIPSIAFARSNSPHAADVTASSTTPATALRTGFTAHLP